MSHNIVALSQLHLLPETEEQISNLSTNPVRFSKGDVQSSIEELIARTGESDIILISPGTIITTEYLKACPRVKCISLCGTSKANIDLEAVTAQGVTLLNVVDYGDEPTAEFIFMQLAYLARGMGEYQWRDSPVELMGKSLGIIGLGALGRAVARLALAYKMNTSYHSRTRKPDIEQQGIHYLEKQDLLAQNDIIIITSPTNLIVVSQDDFKSIKHNAVLVQASTGSCINRDGFLEWIAKDGNFAIFGYSAGNVNYESYKDIPRVIFPKVVAGRTIETRQRLGEKVLANLKSYLERM